MKATITIFASDGTHKAILHAEAVEAAWCALDPKGEEAAKDFRPSKVFEVIISTPTGMLRSIVEQKYAAITRER